MAKFPLKIIFLHLLFVQKTTCTKCRFLNDQFNGQFLKSKTLIMLCGAGRGEGGRGAGESNWWLEETDWRGWREGTVAHQQVTSLHQAPALAPAPDQPEWHDSVVRSLTFRTKWKHITNISLPPSIILIFLPSLSLSIQYIN